MKTTTAFRSNLIPLLLGAFIMMLLACYDNYPIVTNDSGTYISCAFSGEIPADRPVFYSWFIRVSSLGQSLWLTVWAQSFILAYLLLRLMRFLVPDISNPHSTALFLLFSLGTIGGWYSSQLMPDVFTPVLCLSLLLYLLDRTNKTHSLVYAALVLLAALMHNAHPIILSLFTLLLLAALLLKRAPFLKPATLATLAGLSAASWLLLCMVNASAGNGFRPSKATPVFLMGKLAESGILKTYLDQRCPVKEYKICAYKDSLPVAAFSFVWDGNSPVNKTGGWDANREEYGQILRDLATSPRYYPLLAYKSLEATARQLTQINIDESYALPWTVFDASTPPYQSIARYIPHERNAFHTSRQNEKTLSISLYDKVYALVFLLSTLAVLLGHRHLPRGSGLVYTLLLTLIILNAFSTATFANILPRLNSRVIWLLPAGNLLMIYTAVRNWLASRKPLDTGALH
jgi:hypothetical protein